VYLTVVSTGEKRVFTDDFESVHACEKSAERWLNRPRDKFIPYSISCNKWMKIAPAGGLG